MILAYELATWLAIVILGLGGVAVFVTFVVDSFRSGRHPPNPPS